MNTAAILTRVQRLAVQYAGAIAFAALTLAGLIALYLVLDLAAISSTNVHVVGTAFVLALAGLGAWAFHAEVND